MSRFDQCLFIIAKEGIDTERLNSVDLEIAIHPTFSETTEMSFKRNKIRIPKPDDVVYRFDTEAEIPSERLARILK